ncbi:AI-2E family transporter [Flammeovirgaceae bacterium SG7u.111]|nr:AI-2E family transporter [Flammeovirgaceae bacterium SG7u.132]WPO38459.1 AI-2E family transporter [Flammeovirgaceae bacterium SG7u.111]
MINKTALNLLIGVVILLALGWFFADIVTYIALALVLTGILRTPTNYISQFQVYGIRVPRAVATLLAFSLIIGLFSLFVYLFVPLVSDQINVISELDLDDIVVQIKIPINGFEQFLLKNGLISETNQGFVLNRLKETVAAFLESFEFTTILNSVLSLTSSLLIGFMAVFFIAFFLLNEKGLFKRHLIAMIPNQYYEVTIAAFSKVEKLLSNYLLGLLLQMISIFSIVSFGLLVVGVEYAVTIGVFAAVANLIPYLGPILGGTFGLIVGISTNLNLASSESYLLLAAKILIVFGFVQFIDNIFLQPIIFSKSVKAHPVEIFLIVFVGANLGGPVGMIAAIPSYTIVKVTFLEFYKGYRQYHVFRK